VFGINFAEFLPPLWRSEREIIPRKGVMFLYGKHVKGKPIPPGAFPRKFARSNLLREIQVRERAFFVVNAISRSKRGPHVEQLNPDI
jgi:hypothetical protein